MKVWDITTTGGNLKLSWTYHGLNNNGEEIRVEDGPEDTPGATAVEAIKMDLKRVAVAYQNTVVKIFDIESGEEQLKLQPEIVAGRCFEFWRSGGVLRLSFRGRCVDADQCLVIPPHNAPACDWP